MLGRSRHTVKAILANEMLRMDAEKLDNTSGDTKGNTATDIEQASLGAQKWT
jgi:hypothetical protein